MTSAELLFESILNDYKVADGNLAINRSLNDYYFDIMEKFDLETLQIGKVLNNARDVIVFGAVTKAGQKMDIYYHNGSVKIITDFTPEMVKWRASFLEADKLRSQHGDGTSKDAKTYDPISGIDKETTLKDVARLDRDYERASEKLIQLYAG